MYIQFKPVEIEWDPAKAQENLRVHGINFAAAAGVFNNPYLPRKILTQRAKIDL